MTFFDQYSFKIKNRALLFIIALILIVVYKRVIQETLELRKVNLEINKKLQLSTNSNYKIKSLQRDIFLINKYLGVESSKEKKTLQQFLAFLYDKNKQIEIENISDVIVFNHPDFKINSYKIALKSDFLNSLKFLYELETKFNYARVVSVAYEIKKTMHSDSEYLSTTLIIQNYSR